MRSPFRKDSMASICSCGASTAISNILIISLVPPMTVPLPLLLSQAHPAAQDSRICRIPKHHNPRLNHPVPQIATHHVPEARAVPPQAIPHSQDHLALRPYSTLSTLRPRLESGSCQLPSAPRSLPKITHSLLLLHGGCAPTYPRCT